MVPGCDKYRYEEHAYWDVLLEVAKMNYMSVKLVVGGRHGLGKCWVGDYGGEHGRDV